MNSGFAAKMIEVTLELAALTQPRSGPLRLLGTTSWLLALPSQALRGPESPRPPRKLFTKGLPRIPVSGWRQVRPALPGLLVAGLQELVGRRARRTDTTVKGPHAWSVVAAASRVVGPRGGPGQEWSAGPQAGGDIWGRGCAQCFPLELTLGAQWAGR